MMNKYAVLKGVDMIKFAEEVTHGELDHYLKSWADELEYKPDQGRLTKILILRNHTKVKFSPVLTTYRSDAHNMFYGVVLKHNHPIYISDIQEEYWGYALLRAIFYVTNPGGFDFPDEGCHD